VITMPYLVERTFRESDPRCREMWPEHLRYLHSLAAGGALVAGGNWESGPGEVLMIEAPDEVALHRILRGDPLFRGSLVAKSRIRGWSVDYGHSALTGKRPGAAARPASGTLTPHESRIADMVLAGMTNQKIAERLNVSCRAVEQHLTRMYRKLGIRRRAQLAMALGGTAPNYRVPRQERRTA
jgi:DNA-binding CsgD family transcriptional regulator/uncharacterized protein YciI